MTTDKKPKKPEPKAPKMKDVAVTTEPIVSIPNGGEVVDSRGNTIGLPPPIVCASCGNPKSGGVACVVCGN